MVVISVDLGSYSIKFLVSKIERGKVTHEYWRESVLDLDEIDVTDEFAGMDLKIKLISEFLEKIDTDYRLVMLPPEDIMTTRFVSVPVKQKDKARKMIPFQMEEDLPYTLTEAHLGMSLTPYKTHTESIVSICRQDDFKPFFDKLEKYQVVPALITTSPSILSHFVNKKFETISDSFCIIDIGHETTKAYFFFNKKLVSTHVSFIAGKTIDEAICENYNISEEEASVYKHQNCFLLTEDQYSKVDEAQGKFAILMDKTLNPLMLEFKRWELGFRITYGLNLTEIFLTGGSSNIKNIHNYWTERVGVRADFLNSYNNVNTDKIDSDAKQRRKFNLANIMSICYPNRSSLINMLNGHFNIQGTVDLPIHSFAYLAHRVAIMTLVIFMAMIVERVFIGRDIEQADKKMTALIKNPLLQVSPTEQRSATKNPVGIHTKLIIKQKFITQEVKSLQSAISINALTPLMSIRDLVSGTKATLKQFNSSGDGLFSAIFESEDIKELEIVQKAIDAMGYKDVFTDLNQQRKTLELSASLK